MEYTQRQQDFLWKSMNIEVENGYSQISQILNEEFRTFGDGIADEWSEAILHIVLKR